MTGLRRIAQFAFIAVCSAVISCASDTTELQATVDNIVLSLGLNTLTVGQTVQAGAIARDASGGSLTGVSIAWASSNTSVVTVSSAGLVTAVAPGSAQITASAAGKTVSANVTVVTASVTSVAVSLSATSVGVGQPVTATAVTRDASNNILTGRAITWASSNTAVATVSSSGAVTTLAAGSTNIMATSEGVTGSATLTVGQSSVASVTVSLGSSTVAPGASTSATATVRDASNNVLTGRPITWSSSNISVATIDASGNIQGVTQGSVTITATSEGISGTATLNVQAGVGSVTVSLGINPISVGATSTASAVVRDVNNVVLTGRTITWSSSNTTVATVGATTGVVQAVSVGSATITATCEGVSGSATQNVQALAATVTVSLSPTTIAVNGTSTATAVVRDVNNSVLTGRTIAWSTSNSAVATVGSDGTVTGTGNGTAFIAAKVDTASGFAPITVGTGGGGGGGGGGPTATHLNILVQPGGVVSGVNFTTPAVIQLLDANNVVVPTNTFVTATLASGTGVLTGATSVAAVNGVATFTNLRINGVGQHSITFSAGALPTVTSNAFTVTQVPASLSFRTSPGGSVTGTPLTSQPVIQISDNAGLVIATSTATVTASVISGNATLVGTTSVAAVAGVATFTNLQLNGLGLVTLGFSTSNPNLQVQSSPIGVAQGPPTHLSVSTQPAGASSGLTIATQPVIQLLDVNNGVALGTTNQVTAAITSGTGTLLGTTTVAAVNGVATFTNLKINGVGAHTLTFTSAGLTQTSSSSFTVSQIPAALVMRTQPGGAVSGSPFTQQPAIEIRDNANLLIANSTQNVTASISTGSGTLGGTQTVAAVAGVATFGNLQITGTGNFMLNFATTSPSLGVQSAQFSVGSQAVSSATQLAITTQPAGAVSGVNLTTQPIVEIRDANNTLVNNSTAAVTATITSGGGSLAGTTTVNAVNGVATFTNLKINGAGNGIVITFSSSGLTAAVANGIASTQTPASLSIQTQPNGAVTGASLTTQPVIRILDNAGLVVTGSTLQVTAARTSGTATLSGTTQVNAVAGVATFTNLRLDGSGSNTLTFSTAAPALNVQSQSITVQPGAASALVMVTQPNGSVSGFPLVVQPVLKVVDVSGNTVTSSSVPVTATLVGTGTLSGNTTVAAVNGIVTFSNLAITGNAAVTLQFTANPLTPVTSAAVTPQAPGSLSGSVADLGNAAVGGGTVEIVSGNTVVRSATVAANGTFTVNGIAVGSYGARLQPPLAYSMGPSEPPSQPITITAGNTTNQNFVVQPAIYSDDFQSYASTAQLTAGCNAGSIPAGSFFAGANHDMNCSAPLQIFLDPTPPAGLTSGGQAMRYDWPARPTSGISGNYTVAMMPRFNPPPVQGSTMYVRWTDYMPQSFRIGGSGATGSQLEYKYLFIDVMPPATGIPLGTYVFEMDSQTSAPSNLLRVRTKLVDFRSTATDSDPNNYVLGPNFLGAWHTWVAEITGIGTATTTFNIWLDGVMIQSISGPFFQGVSLGGVGSIMTIELGANINNGPDGVQSRWFREFGVYKTRPSMLRLP